MKLTASIFAFPKNNEYGNEVQLLVYDTLIAFEKKLLYNMSNINPFTDVR